MSMTRQLELNGTAARVPTSVSRTAGENAATAGPAEDGAFLVDGRAAVLFANAAARQLLAERDRLRLSQAALATPRPADTAALRRLIAAAAEGDAGGSLLIRRDERPSLLLLVMPLTVRIEWLGHEPLCAVILTKELARVGPLSLAAFARHYGLTPAQRALLHEIVKGDGAAAAAARLGISYATARCQLVQIYQKTYVGRQTELVRLALQWSAGPSA
jgi:DNA-binding CsgD family transcriptional regulator